MRWALRTGPDNQGDSVKPIGIVFVSAGKTIDGTQRRTQVVRY
jgi:hypothetical protein